MGITGELVRSVFSKSRSFRTHETYNVKRSVVEKKRWKSSVRAYLCGDDLLFNSVLAEEDTASVKSSEATVTQPRPGGGSTEESEDFTSEETTQHDSSDQDNSHIRSLLHEHTAAVVIQSAFRGFMVRRLNMAESADTRSDFFKGFGSPSRDSLATSIEVQTGNSVGVASIQEECPSVSVCNKLQQKHKPSLFRQKEDWDDSTVDSSVSKMRIRNRLEATTRRERALAYAFSQQLRICSKKKQNISDSTEPNTGWSWLERWMATRQPEGSSVEDRISKQLTELTIAMKTKPIAKTKFLDLSFEEKESCGSNEIPLQLDGSDPKTCNQDGYKSARNTFKAAKNISRRKTVPTGHYQKVNKRDFSIEAEMDKEQNVKQSESSSSVYNDVLQLSDDHYSVASQNTKFHL